VGYFQFKGTWYEFAAIPKAAAFFHGHYVNYCGKKKAGYT
jgi:hypothetical protein